MARMTTAIGSKGRMSPPATPSVPSATHSRQTSTDYTSEAAQEIVVWTEDMEIDSESQAESEDSSALQQTTEYVPLVYASPPMRSTQI